MESIQKQSFKNLVNFIFVVFAINHKVVKIISLMMTYRQRVIALLNALCIDQGPML
jgi:hypothetical protein